MVRAMPNNLLVALAFWSALGAPATAGDLSERLQPLIDQHRGKVSVAVRHLETGEQFCHRADEPMPTASLIKLAVMVEVYQQAAEGRVRLEDRVELSESDKVAGAGILTPHFSAGASFSLRDAVRLMIVFSDNTATNLVLDRVGIASTADRMARWGYPNTKIHSKVFRRDTSVFPERSAQFGLGSTTAAEMIGLLKELHDGDRITERDRAVMLDHLRHCDDREKFPRYLQPGIVVAHKTGSVESARTDAGILYTKRGAVAVCVLTSENEDKRWRIDNAGNVLCAEVARAVCEHFSNE